MRRYIVYLICGLLCCFGSVSSGSGAGSDAAEGIKSEFAPCVVAGRNLTEECDGPPWGERCDEYYCGTEYALGYLHGGWSDAAINLVVHSTAPVEVLVTWIDSTGSDFLGSRLLELDGGNYSVSFEDILLEIFDSRSSTHIGAIRLDWRSCGNSFLYFHSWSERRGADKPDTDGQRAAVRNRKLCPTTGEAWGDVCLPANNTVNGCYEVPVPPSTEFIRAQLVSTSDTDWQIILVDGIRVEVPPLVPELPGMVEFTFVPSAGIIEVCVGREDPWSGGFEISDACVLSNFEAVETDTKRRISIPAHPELIY